MREWSPGAPPLDAQGAPFASGWDRALAASGPPTVFTLDPRGELRADPERTRECELLVGLPEPREPAHYVLTDTRTGVALYLFVTHPALAECQPRGVVQRYSSARDAIDQTMKQWAVPPAEPAGSAADDEG